MRVIEVRKFGGPEVLELVERPEPEVKPGQVLVRVAASTINPIDGMTRGGAAAGLFPDLQPPFVLGWDLAGTVQRSGNGFEAGQRVIGMAPWYLTRSGSNAELVAVDSALLVAVPDDVDLTAAATLPLNGLTARQALDLADLSAGQTLFVTGASGAVGAFVVQFAAARGVHVIATASNGDAEYVAGLGAKTVLGRNDRPDTPVDAVLDAATIGPELLALVRDGGAFVAAAPPAMPVAERRINVNVVQVKPDADQLAEIAAGYAKGELKTRVHRRFPAEQAVEAYLVAEQSVRGKVVLTFD